MKMRLSIALAFLLVSKMSFAQELPDVIPPSPTAAELMKYGDIPVSLYTGTPNINIPIHEISINGYTLPISLSYHASGIRVSDVGSNVGLGWSLNAGGVLGVNKVGANDEVDLVGYTANEKQTFYNRVKSGSLDKFNLNHINLESYIDLIAADILQNHFDYEPDIYTYNFGQTSGKFLKATDDEYYTYPFDKLKIIKEPQGTGETGYKWKLVSKDGTEFFFGSDVSPMTLAQGNEVYLINDGLIGGNPDPAYYFPTSWYLRKVKRPGVDNDIEITYVSKDERYQVLPSATVGWNQDNGNVFLDTTSPVQNDEHQYDGLSRIDEITAPNTIIRFYHNINRNDMNAGKLLSKIEVINSNSSQVIKTFTLTYENTTDRVFLKTVQETGKPAYEFEYYSGLPNRFSKAQDHWGYYNNENNTHLIPEPDHPDIWRTLPTIVNSANAANRETNKDVMHYGSLKEIVYPTGGRTVFTYSANKFSESRFAFEEEATETQTNTTVTSSGTQNPITQTIQLAKAEDVTFNIDYTNYLVPPGNNDGDALNPIIQVKNLSTNAVTTWKATDKNENEFINDNVSLNTKKISYSETLSLAAGSYQIIANVECSQFGCMGSIIPQSKVSFQYTSALTYPDERGAYTGGIRIQNIKNYTDATSGSLALEKNYDYGKGDGFSSGHLKYRHVYAHNYLKSDPYDPNTNGCLIYHESFTFTSTDQFTQGINSGHIGYKQVTEYLSVGEQGKTVYNYRYVVPQGPTGIYPYAPFYGDLFMNGMLEKSAVFKGSTNNYTKIAETENTYTISTSNKKTFEGIKIGHYMNQDDSCGPVNDDQIVSSVYTNDSKWYYLSQTIDTQYDEAGSNPRISTTNYYYDNADHIQLTRTETTNSEGKTITTSSLYPDDLKTASTLQDNSPINGGTLGTYYAAADRLKADDLFQIATPIQVETTVKDGATVLSETIQRTNFSEPHTDMVLPNNIQVVKGAYNASTNPLETKIEFLSYYDNGNVKEVKKTNGTTIVYLWGYKERYPVAKVENATISALEATLSPAELTAVKEGTYDQSTMINTLNKIRLGLTDAMVSTYTYDPLVGVTSMTDPKGYVMYYEYDGLNRLEFIKDADGNLVSENKYNYKN